MGEQLEFKMLERKDEVFYVRCRPKIKQALYLQMTRDKFTSMTDWFEQFVTRALEESCQLKPKKLKKKKVSGTSRAK